MKRILFLLLAATLFACNTSPDQFTSTKRIEFQPYIHQSSIEQHPSSSHQGSAKDSLRGNILRIRVQTSPWDVATRACPIEHSEDLHDPFSVTAYVYHGAWNKHCKPSAMYDVGIHNRSGRWTSDEAYFLPQEYLNVRFFAYAPYQDTCFSLSPKDQEGYPTLECRIADEVAQQKDLLAAQTTLLASYHAQPIALRFRHLLTAIQFHVGEQLDPSTIRSIRLKGIASHATYSWDEGQEHWTYAPEKHDYTLFVHNSNSANDKAELLEKEQTLILLPQKLGNDASLEIEFENEGKPSHLSVSLSESEWLSGHRVIYRLSSDRIDWNYTFELLPPSDVPFSGGSCYFEVQSAKHHPQAEDRAVGWTAEFWDERKQQWLGTPPQWLDIPLHNAGSIHSKRFEATLDAQTEDHPQEIPLDQQLQKAPSKGSNTRPYNLAHPWGWSWIYDTANCYVINSAGYYSLPLVYGNAIKHGQDNPSAYQDPHLVDHLGLAISSPYIAQNHPAQIHHATLLWQDRTELITRVHLSQQKDALLFEIDPAKIGQGNAVVAVVDSQGEVLWSWHLWVTPIDLEDTCWIPHLGAARISCFMKVNLGWMAQAPVKVYAGREVKVRLTQDRSKLSRTFTIHQNSHVSGRTFGSSPYYQWGRKDPLPRSDGSQRQCNIKLYNESGEEIAMPHSGSIPCCEAQPPHQSPCQAGIRHPMCFLKNYGKGNHGNLWSGHLAHTHNEKTIYDPAPVGFRVPHSSDFEDLKPSGTDRDFEQEQGRNFTSDSFATLFLSAEGFRLDGQLSHVGQEGYYWVSAQGSSTESSPLNPCFFFEKSNVTTRKPTEKEYALTIRCIEDF